MFSLFRHRKVQPTYNEIMEIPVGTLVRVTLRETSGERARLSGVLYAPKPGARCVGPITIARQRLGRSEYEPGNIEIVPFWLVEISW